MTSTRRQFIGTLLGAIFILLASCGLKASANPVPKGITVSPAYQSIDVLNSVAQQPVNFSVTNNESTTQTINLKTADINSINYTGGLLFVGSNASSLEKQYGLAKWLVLPETSLTIPPGHKASITLNIDNLPSLAPGGHYGALLMYIANGSADSSQSNNVDVNPVASSLMFVTKVGGATYKLSLSSVEADHNLFKLPSSATLRFYNYGNTQLTPRGYINLVDSSRHLIAKGIINPDSSLILPAHYLDIQVPLQSVALSKHIGEYKLEVFYGFDGYNNYRLYQSSMFLATPGLVLIIILVLLIATVVALVTYRHIRKQRKHTPVSHKPKVTRIKVQ